MFSVLTNAPREGLQEPRGPQSLWAVSSADVAGHHAAAHWVPVHPAWHHGRKLSQPRRERICFPWARCTPGSASLPLKREGDVPAAGVPGPEPPEHPVEARGAEGLRGT